MLKKIKDIILEIGKTDISFDRKEKDYLFNGKPPRALDTKHYTNLHSELKERLYTQLKENCDMNLIEKYIEYTKSQIKVVTDNSNLHRVNFLMQRNDEELADSAKDTHDDIRAIISTINSVLAKFQVRLEKELEFVDYKTKSDYQDELDNIEFDNNDISFNEVGRITFKMSKKESLLLLFVMEKEGLIEFESEVQRRKFIETNFNYTEVRNNKDKGKAFPMTGVNSELSTLKASHEAKPNNKALERVLDKLNNTIHLHQFK